MSHLRGVREQANKETEKGQNVERLPVSSSGVSAIGYDAETQALEVEYNRGGVYKYQRVPQDVFDQLMKASSKGAFINEQIKDSYAFIRVS